MCRINRSLLWELDDTFCRACQSAFGIVLKTDLSVKKLTLFKTWEKVLNHCNELEVPPFMYFQVLFEWMMKTGKEMTREWLNWLGSDTAKSIVSSNKDLAARTHTYGDEGGTSLINKIVDDIRTTKRLITQNELLDNFDFKELNLNRLSPFYLAVDEDWRSLGHKANPHVVEEVLAAQRVLRGSGLVDSAKKVYYE